MANLRDAAMLLLTPFFAASAAYAAPTIEILSPLPGQVIEGNQVAVNMSLFDFTVVDYLKFTQPRSGQGHIHLWMDQAEPSKSSAIKTTSSMYIFNNVKEGSHTLLAELVNNDHSSLKPPATSSVTFTTVSRPVSYANSTSVLWMSIVAFSLVAAALFMISTKGKFKPKAAKTTKKSRKY